MKILENNKIHALAPFVAAIIPLLFSLYFWRKGWNEPAITFTLLGIGLLSLGVLLGTIKKIIANNRVFVIVATVILIAMGLYCWISRGYIYTGIFAILVGIVVILREMLKGKRWQIGITVAFALGIGILVYLEKTSENKRHTIGREAGVQQDAMSKTSKPNNVLNGKTSISPSQQTVDMMNRILTTKQLEDPTVQKVMEVIASDSFQKQLEQQDPQTLKEYFQLFASQGVTEVANMDFDKMQAGAYQFAAADYSARNPGKVPQDEEVVMTRNLVAAIDQFGLMVGMREFMKNPENVMWMNAHFKGDKEAYHEWMFQVRNRVKTEQASRGVPTPESGDSGSPSLSTRELQQDIPFDENAPQVLLAEPEPTEAWEDYTIPDTEKRAAAVPAIIEPEKLVTDALPSTPAPPIEKVLETTLRERFSSERFKRAMSTLERYGPEEGFRRLRESDPEIAKQIENYRLAGVEQHQGRAGSEEESQ